MLKKFCLFNYFDGKSNENIKDFVVSFDHLKKFNKDFHNCEHKHGDNKLQKSIKVKEKDLQEEGSDPNKHLQNKLDELHLMKNSSELSIKNPEYILQLLI